MKHLQNYLFVGLLVGLLALVAIRPWGQLNQAAGIITRADTLRADSLAHAELDSLIIDPSLAATVSVMADPASDSLNYSVEARQKKKAYLQEQSALLQKQNQALETKVKKQQKSLQEKQQSLLSMEQIEQALAKQSSKVEPSKQLAISDLETEVNSRAGGRSNTRP